MSLKVTDKVTGRIISFDDTLLESGDEVFHLINLIKQSNINFGSNVIVYHLCPHPKLIKESVKLVNGGEYQMEFSVPKRVYAVSEVTEFMKEINSYSDYTNLKTHEIELILQDGSQYFGQVSTISSNDGEKIFPHGKGISTSTE